MSVQTIRTRADVEPGEAHVLVIEDSVSSFVLVARMLSLMGIQRCEWKMSGWQLLQLVDTLPALDLILMDIRLPYEDGYQVIEKIRANPRLRNTVIAAISSQPSHDHMWRARRAGFNGYIGKPFEPSCFPDQVRRLLTGDEVWEWK